MWEKKGIFFYDYYYFQFATGALEHRVYEVRDVALRIILDMYRRHKGAVLEYLPPDDASARKTVLYKTLFDGFARIDGKLSEAETRVCHGSYGNHCVRSSCTRHRDTHSNTIYGVVLMPLSVNCCCAACYLASP